MDMDFPYTSRLDVTGDRGTSGRGVCARGKCQRDALLLHGTWRRDHWTRGPYLFVERKGWLEGNHLRAGRDRMDRSGDHDLRRLESTACRVRCLFVCLVAMAWACPSAQPAEYPITGFAGGSVSSDDSDAPTGKHR